MGKGEKAGLSEHDLHAMMIELEREYPCRVRIWARPLDSASKRPQVAYYAQAYDLKGKSMGDQFREQMLWPNRNFLTGVGMYYHLLWKLQGTLDSWQAERLRQEEAAEEGALTPLEEYIAGVR